MKQDTQHLDYLISQYVDGCLDPASRKSLEQQLVNNPAARQLYKGHRDVQDMLDDWGNRIPLINWADFDNKLARRLENEVIGSQPEMSMLRRLRPLAAAAALFLAVGLGYAWRAWSSPQIAAPLATAIPRATPEPRTPIDLEGRNTPARPSKSFVQIPEAPGNTPIRTTPRVALIPDDPVAPLVTPGSSPRNIHEVATDFSIHGPSSVGGVPPAKLEKEPKDPGPAFP